jgi:hypothetical protein
MPETQRCPTSNDGAPYLAVSLTLSPAIIANLFNDLPDAAPGAGPADARDYGFSVAAVTPDLMDAWVRC